MGEWVILHEAGADLGSALGLADIAARVGTLDQVEHEIGQHHDALRRLHHAAAHLRGGCIRNVLMFCDESDLFLGQVAVVETVANR